MVHLAGHNPPRVLISDSKGTNNRPKVIFQHVQWKNGKHALEGIYARPDGEGLTLPLIVDLLLFGHSAGASLVNHMIARTNRFRAAVSWEGYPDEELSFYLGWGGEGIAFARHLYGGSPIEVPFVYRRQSATTYADRVKTPILLLHGDDCTAPAIKWFTVLREYGVEAELVFYQRFDTNWRSAI